MISLYDHVILYDHIIELRAELTSCYLSKRERATIQAELKQALARKAELDRSDANGSGE
jgi:hypothetical protein